MHDLPIEIKCHILNQFVFFFDPTLKEKQIFTRSAKCSLLPEDVVSNVRALVHISELNREWYEFMNHKRLNRLWKSCYFMEMRQYDVEVEKEVLKGTNSSQTLTEIYKDATRRRFLRICNELYCLDLQNALYEADVDKLATLLERFEVEDSALIANICESLANLDRYEDENYLVCLATIMNSEKGYVLLLGHPIYAFIKSACTVPKHMKLLFSFLKKPSLKAKLLQLFESLEDMEPVDVHLCKRAYLDDFLLLEPYLRDYRMTINVSRELHPILQVLTQYNVSIVVKKLTSMKSIGPLDTTRCLEHIFQHYSVSQSDPEIAVLVEFFLKHLGVDPMRPDNDYVLHYALYGCPHSPRFYEALFRKYKKWLAPRLLVKYCKQLPIEVYLNKPHWARESTQQTRFAMLDILIGNCPDLNVYKQSKVYDSLLVMIKDALDVKHSYLKYLKLLQP